MPHRNRCQDVNSILGFEFGFEFGFEYLALTK